MKSRLGEKIGWTAGWLGGFLWVFLLAIVFLVQGKIRQGALGMTLAGIAMFAIVFFAPWRFPTTPYWKLMLAPYGMFFLSVAWGIESFGGFQAAGLTWWNLSWLLLFLFPFASLSKKRWTDSLPGQDTSRDAAKPPRRR